MGKTSLPKKLGSWHINSGRKVIQVLMYVPHNHKFVFTNWYPNTSLQGIEWNRLTSQADTQIRNILSDLLGAVNFMKNAYENRGNSRYNSNTIASTFTSIVRYHPNSPIAHEQSPSLSSSLTYSQPFPAVTIWRPRTIRLCLCVYATSANILCTITTSFCIRSTIATGLYIQSTVAANLYVRHRFAFHFSANPCIWPKRI